MTTQIEVETQAKFLQHTLSIALWFAQELGWVRECDAILTVIRDVSTRRVALEGSAS